MPQRPQLLALVVLTALAATHAVAEQPAALVSVDPVYLNVNGQREAPVGLLGVHAFKITQETREQYGIEAYRGIHFGPGSSCLAIGKDSKIKPQFKGMPVVIDCQGDRYARPTVLDKKDFADYFARIGRDYAQKCKDAGHDGIAEFWNEPYLNWSSRSYGDNRASVYSPKWYKTEGRVDGGRVTIKGWDEPLEHLRWRRYWAAGEPYMKKNKKTGKLEKKPGKIFYGVEVPEGLEPGDKFKGQSPSNWYWTDRTPQTFTVVEHWNVYDASAKHWWSGPQNLQFYMWMFEPWAKAIKETNPDIRIIAGFDFGLSHGDWDVFRTLITPLIDNYGPMLEGITDHRYGVNSRWAPMWYETIAHYGKLKHDTWIRGYNTECGGKLDPAVYGLEALKDEAKDKVSADAAAATYLLRDVIELMHHCPAKAGSRTTHHPRKGGELFALQFLKPLRGDMLRSHSNDPDLWTIASLKGNRVVLVVFNDAEKERDVRLYVTPPGKAKATAQLRTIEADATEQSLVIRETPVTVESGKVDTTVRMPGRTAAMLIVPLTAVAEQIPVVVRTQHFAREGVLLDQTANAPVKMTVPLTKKQIANADRARIKLLLENLGEGDYDYKLNGVKRVADPLRPFTNIRYFDPSLLEGTNTIEVVPPEGSGTFRVVSASIEIDQVSGE